jgi:hypothetical protein
MSGLRRSVLAGVAGYVGALLCPWAGNRAAAAHGKACGGEASRIVREAHDGATIRHYDGAGRLIQVVEEHPEVVFTWEYTAE